MIIPELIDRMEYNVESDVESDNESDDENKEERKDNDQTINEMLKITSGFLSNQNGIFGNSKDHDRTPKTRKTGRSLFSCVKGILTNNTDDPGEVNNNAINSNINPTHLQKRVKNFKENNKTNSRLSYNNKDMK